MSEEEEEEKTVTCDTWHVTHDMWHMTCDMCQGTNDMWQVTCDTWHVTGDGVWTFPQYFSFLAHMICDLSYFEDLEEKDCWPF